MISDDDPTIWSIVDHTATKHKILRKYLEVQIPILSKRYRIVFLEGRFVELDVYKDDKPKLTIIPNRKEPQ